MIDSPKEYSLEYILSAIHIESYKPSPSQYSEIGMLHNTVVGHYGLVSVAEVYLIHECV